MKFLKMIVYIFYSWLFLHNYGSCHIKILFLLTNNGLFLNTTNTNYFYLKLNNYEYKRKLSLIPLVIVPLPQINTIVFIFTYGFPHLKSRSYLQQPFLR